MCLRFDPRAAGRKAQTDPLSYGGRPTPTDLTITNYTCLGHALQCYVGIGNGSDPLVNEAEHSIGSAPITHDEGFFMRECGERGSQVKLKHFRDLFAQFFQLS